LKYNVYVNVTALLDRLNSHNILESKNEQSN